MERLEWNVVSTRRRRHKLKIYAAADSHHPRGAGPHRCGPPGGVQNSIFSIKNQLNFKVTFKCNFEAYLAQLGSNLAPTWTPKSFQNWSQNDVEMQLPEKLIFATSPIRNARFCFPKGGQKRPKMHSKTTCYTSAFST